MAPIAPFYSDFLFKDLGEKESVHLTNFLSPKTDLIDQSLEEKMSLAQKVSSLILILRKRTQIKVRQPLQRVLITTLNSNFENAIKSVKNIITNEVNVKSIEFISSDDSLLKKKAKANFKVLGPKHGKNMKEIAARRSETIK